MFMSVFLSVFFKELFLSWCCVLTSIIIYTVKQAHVWGLILCRNFKLHWNWVHWTWKLEMMIRQHKWSCLLWSGTLQGPSFFTVSRVREIGCFWGNPVKSTVDPWNPWNTFFPVKSRFSVPELSNLRYNSLRVYMYTSNTNLPMLNPIT